MSAEIEPPEQRLQPGSGVVLGLRRGAGRGMAVRVAPAAVYGLLLARKMRADLFVTPETLMILALGLVAFIFDTIGGVFFAKLLNLFSKKKINPMVGAAGISAFPMSARVIHKMGQQEDKQNFLLMHAVGANVSGQVASVIAGGMILSLVAR